MNKRVFTILILVLLVPGFFSSTVISQSITKLEQTLSQLQNQFEKEQSKLDSISFLYDSYTETIEREKKKINPDKSKITSDMADAVVFFNQIEEQQNVIEVLAEKIETQKKILDSRYLHAIDSLKQVEADVNFMGERDQINLAILSLYEKRVSFMSSSRLLSYNPQKLLSIDLEKPLTDNQKKLYGEYLQNAYSETELKIKDISNLDEKISQVIKLEKKLSSFISDAEFNTGIRTSAVQSNNASKAAESIVDYSGGMERDFLYSQINSNLMLLNQLSFQTTTSIGSTKHWHTLTESEINNLTLDEYSALIKDIKERLINYKSLLKNQLDRLSGTK